MDALTDIYAATLRGLRSEVDRRSAAIAKSFHALPNHESDYAKTHREVIAVHQEVLELIDRKIAERAATS